MCWYLAACAFSRRRRPHSEIPGEVSFVRPNSHFKAAIQAVLCTAAAPRINTTARDWLHVHTTIRDWSSLATHFIGKLQARGRFNEPGPRRGACRAFNIYGHAVVVVPYEPVLSSYRPQRLSDVLSWLWKPVDFGLRMKQAFTVRVSS